MTLLPALLCVHPVARYAGLAVLILGAAHTWWLIARHTRLRWYLPGSYFAVVVICLWLGSLGPSPLGFGRGRFPLVSGFRITRPQRSSLVVAPGAVISLAASAPMEIEPQLLPGPVECTWRASNGGALDDPTSCDTAYEPAQGALYDFLSLRVRSACGLPPTVAQLRISVLP